MFAGIDAGVFDHLSVAFVATDADGLITAWNPAAERLFGWSAAEARGQSVLDLLVPEDQAVLGAEIMDRLRAGEPWEGEFSVRTKSGELRTVFTSEAPFRDESGTVVGMIGISIDVSDRGRLSAMVEASLDAVITIDERGRILDFNAAAEKMFGYDRDDAVGEVMADLIIPPALRDRHWAAFTRYVQTKEATILGRRLELTALRREGDEFPVELTVTDMNPGGTPMFAGFVRDLTHADAAERRLEFLLRASTVLASSLDLDSTLQALARIAVESIADVCIVDLVVDGAVERKALAHRDRSMQEALEPARSFTPDPQSEHPVARVLRTGEPELAERVDEETALQFARTPQLQAVYRTLRPASYMCVPLTAQDRILGSLLLLSTDPERAFATSDLELTSDLARRAGMAIDHASMHERTEQAVQLKEESLALLDTLLATAPVGLAFVDRDLRYVRINDSLAAMNAALPEHHLGRTIREMLPDLADVVEPLHRQVLETGEPILDVEITGGLRGQAGAAHWLASYYPVRGPTGEILGVGAVIVDITERKVAEDELFRVREELTHQLEDLTRLLQLSGRLSGSLELKPVLDEVLRAVVGLQDADAGVLRLYNPERDELEIAASDGVSDAYRERLGRVAASTGVWGRAFSERRPMFSEDVEVDEGFTEVREVMRGEGFRAVYTSPLITRRGDLIGTIATHFRSRRSPSAREGRLIELYAYEAADVIDNARLFREARDAQDRLEFLAEASRILSASLDYHRTLQEVSRLVVPRLADWCSIDVKDEDGTIRQVAVAHADPAKLKWALELQERYPPDANAPTGSPNVIRTGKSELYPEIPQGLMEMAIGEDEELRRIVDEIGFTSLMVVPLTARGRTLGALSFVSAESGQRYGPRDLAFAEDLARRAAQAVDNARLFSHQLHIARTLQHSLLPPRLPEIPGVEVAARYQAAGQGTEVGGDFYDLFETVGEEWGIVMGDVCGKGPEAAAVTGLARYTIRAAAMRDRSPARILRVLNDAIRQQREDLRFATVAYARMHRENGGVNVEVSCGGHPLPLVLRRDGRVDTVGHPGTLLGIFEETELQDDATLLEPGDAVVLYTDGVSQERTHSGALTEEDLAELVAASVGVDAEGIADRILAAVIDEPTGESRDDVAILVLRVQP